MKNKILIAAAAMCLAAPAMAWEGKVVACYGKVWSPATYSTKEVLVKKAKTKWEHRNGQLVKVDYAPVYKEVKTLKHPGHWIMREEACK